MRAFRELYQEEAMKSQVVAVTAFCGLDVLNKIGYLVCISIRKVYEFGREREVDVFGKNWLS